MAINFTNTGYINFNKEYNKVLKNGALTVSISFSNKIVKDGKEEYKQQYINGLIPAKFVDEIKPLIGKLVDMQGVLTFSNVVHGKGYLNATIFKVTEHAIKTEEQDKNDFILKQDEIGLPF